MTKERRASSREDARYLRAAMRKLDAAQSTGPPPELFRKELQRTITLQELKHQSLMRRAHLVRPVERLALIYRALRDDCRARVGDFSESGAVRELTPAELMAATEYRYDASMTFYEFVRANWLPTYEVVAR